MYGPEPESLRILPSPREESCVRNRAGHATILTCNVIIFSGHKIVDFCILSLILYLHTETVTFFALFLLTEAELRCGVVIIAKLKN